MHPLEHAFKTAWPPHQWCDVTVLLAVSGGADSVALLRAAKACRAAGPGRLIVAHFNHRLRAADSDADAQFVQRLAEQLGLSCEIGISSGPLDSGGEGLESVLRAARYEFLTQAAHKYGARYIGTAHTADDQAETILHRVLRGTGMAGLAGIPRTRPLGPAAILVRPLLDVWRSEVLDYLTLLGQPYCTDLTNLDRRFTRNRLRYDLLPHLAETYNPQIREALLRMGLLAHEAQELIDEHVAQWERRLVQYVEPGRVAVTPPSSNETVSDYLLRDLFVRIWRKQGWPAGPMTHGHWCDLAQRLRRTGETAAATSTGPKPFALVAPTAPDLVRIFPGEIRVEIARGVLCLARAGDIADDGWRG